MSSLPKRLQRRAGLALAVAAFAALAALASCRTPPEWIDGGGGEDVVGVSAELPSEREARRGAEEDARKQLAEKVLGAFLSARSASGVSVENGERRSSFESGAFSVSRGVVRGIVFVSYYTEKSRRGGRVLYKVYVRARADPRAEGGASAVSLRKQRCALRFLPPEDESGGEPPGGAEKRDLSGAIANALGRFGVPLVIEKGNGNEEGDEPAYAITVEFFLEQSAAYPRVRLYQVRLRFSRGAAECTSAAYDVPETSRSLALRRIQDLIEADGAFFQRITEVLLEDGAQP